MNIKGVILEEEGPICYVIRTTDVLDGVSID